MQPALWKLFNSHLKNETAYQKKRNHHTNSQFSIIQPSSDKKAPNLTVGSFRKPKGEFIARD